MGSRKRIMADKMKEARKSSYHAILRNCPIAPRKMRLVADMIRGINVGTALDQLRFNPKHSAQPIEKLLRSALANWQNKNEGVRMEDANLFVKEIQVDGARMLKRLRPAPQGRGHRIRKRYSHITLVVASRENAMVEETTELTKGND